MVSIDGSDVFLSPAFLAALASTLLFGAQIRVWVRRPRPRRIRTFAWARYLRPGALLGFTLAFSHPADALGRRSPLPSRPVLIASEPPGMPVSPGLPDDLLTGAGTPPWEQPGEEGALTTDGKPSNERTVVMPKETPIVERSGAVHPAIHGERRGTNRAPGKVTPLFPRETKGAPWGESSHDGNEGGSGGDRTTDCEDSDHAELLACMRRHPSGKTVATAKDGRQRRAGCKHVVRPGDTLWGIAASHLKTDDMRRIARFWPKIHRLNRDVVGENPDLLLPGQTLVLPSECK